MQDISGYGFRIVLKASKTFPNGITLSRFADDSDPFDIPSQQLADKVMDLNGGLSTYSKANPLLVNLGIVPNTDDDKNLAILAEANRAGNGKNPARDVITLTGIFPDGASVTYSEGAITDAPLGQSISSSGRLKSKVYGFAFENMVTTNA